MKNITSAFFIVFASIALAMPAYTQDFKLEQDQLRDITNNLEQLSEGQLKQRKAYLLQQLENAEEGSGGSGSSGSDSKALEKLNLMWVELNIIEKSEWKKSTGKKLKSNLIFKNYFKNFYKTNPIARASVTMSKLSKGNKM